MYSTPPARSRRRLTRLLSLALLVAFAGLGAGLLVARPASAAIGAVCPTPTSQVSSGIEVGWGEAVRLIVRPRVGELLWNTARLAVSCMLACAVLGTVAAWLVERTADELAPAYLIMVAAAVSFFGAWRLKETFRTPLP